MPKVIITQGIPASGKSTWAIDYCKANKNWVRVNRDDLRNMRGEYWLPKQESLITDWERSIIERSLMTGYNVIVDATNLNPKHLDSLKFWLNSLKNRDIETGMDNGPLVTNIEIKFFDISLEEAIKRDFKRQNSVGEKVIRKMYYDYIKTPAQIRLTPFVEGLPFCIICDIDGTLALNLSGRSHYDMSRVGEDVVNPPVKFILNKMFDEDIEIFIFSGRTDSDNALKNTIEWLKENDIFFDQIYMRKVGDVRNDAVFKKELYDTHIKNKFNVMFVLDDRLQVCRMWYELGLPLFRVGDPDANF